MNAISIQQLKFTGPLALVVVALPFSIALCNLAVGLLAISWIIDMKWKGKWEALTSNPSVLIFISFFLLHLVAIIYSTDRQIAWFSVEQKIPFLILPLILASITLGKEDVRFLLNLFIISCLTGTLICIETAYLKTVQGVPNINFDDYTALAYNTAAPHSGNDPWGFFSYIELASGISIHPLYFSLYLTFCVLIIIFFHAASFRYYRRSKQMIIILTLLYLSVFIICLATRIMTIAFFIVVSYGVLNFLSKRSLFTKWSTVFLLMCVLGSFLYLNPVSRFRNYQEVISTWPFLSTGLQTQSPSIHASLWFLGIKSLNKINYLIGAGTGDVTHLVQKTGEEYNIHNIQNNHDPHNQYLYTLLGLGAIGLTVLLSCLILPGVIAFQNKNYFCFTFILIFSFCCLTESVLEKQKGIVFFTLFNSLFLFQPSCIHAYQFKELKA